ncbi:hypothetical protein KCU81_g500, partial [Aureobasidium melanogenum]
MDVVYLPLPRKKHFSKLSTDNSTTIGTILLVAPLMPRTTNFYLTSTLKACRLVKLLFASSLLRLPFNLTLAGRGGGEGEGEASNSRSGSGALLKALENDGKEGNCEDIRFGRRYGYPAQMVDNASKASVKLTELLHGLTVTSVCPSIRTNPSPDSTVLPNAEQRPRPSTSLDSLTGKIVPRVLGGLMHMINVRMPPLRLLHCGWTYATISNRATFCRRLCIDDSV